MSPADSPDLSVVLPTDRMETVARTMECLRSQTARDRLEIILATPSATELGAEPAWAAGFWGGQLVEVALPNLVAGRAAGMRAARAPYAVLAESHSYPEPGWAAALIAAHRRTVNGTADPPAAVGPVIGNPNPGRISWGGLFVDYGPWLEPRERGPADHLPGHNTSYRRDLLLAYGGELETMLEAESVLHWDLRSRGHGLAIEPSAKTNHENIERLLPGSAERFHNSRVFAAIRSRAWPLHRRLLAAAASPLTLAIRVVRTLQEVQRTGRLRVLPGSFPAMVYFLSASTAGELLGYLTGAGDGANRTLPYELWRDRYLKH